MGATLVINGTGVETRVALVENGSITEYYLERKKEKGIVGNIYKGRVVRVLPGMQAAFVDIGLEKAAFLYVSDVFYDPAFSDQQFDLTEGEHEEFPELPDTPEDGESQEPAAEAAATVAPSEPAPAAEAKPQPEVAAVEAQAPQAEAAPVQELAPKVDAPAPEAAAAPEVKEAAPAVEAKESAPQESPAAEAKPEEAPAAEASAGTETPAAETTASAPAATEGQPAEQQQAAGTAAAEGAAVSQPQAEAGGERPKQDGEKSEKGEKGEFRARDRDRRRRRRGSRREGREPREGDGEAREGREPREGREGRDGREGREGREQHDERHGGYGRDKTAGRKMANIQDLLKVGQEIIVQVAKDPIGTKGARVTSHISIPGRHLVFMPTVDHVGISRRIDRESERRRLREIVDRIRPPGTGFIVRTVAENISTEKLEADARFLIGIWNEVGKKKEKLGAPALLHPDLDLTLRATRDLFAQDVEKLVIDDRAEWERVQRFVEAQDPALKDRVVLHDSDEPIFDAYGIEHELNKAMQRKVWLKSGGYLIIDQAEALTAIDVNSGRYVGKKSLEETITKINTEAAKEIVYQLRLRNIGGIIIIDFIDMDKAQNRDKVFKSLQDALGRDKAKTNVLKISELGLVEMTRKRVRESLGRTLNEPCTYCDGRGYLKSRQTVAYEIFREIRREAANYKESTLVVNCHPEVAKILTQDERDELRYLMDRFNKSVQVRAQQGYHQEQFDLYGRSDAPKKGDRREGRDRDREGGRDRDRDRDQGRGQRPQPPGGGNQPSRQGEGGGQKQGGDQQKSGETQKSGEAQKPAELQAASTEGKARQ